MQLIPELSQDGRRPHRVPAHAHPRRAQARLPDPGVPAPVVCPSPLLQRAFRWTTDMQPRGDDDSVGVNSSTSASSTQELPTLSQALRFVSIRDKELRAKLTPDYDFGCKRPTYSNSYYRHVHQAERAPADRRHRADRAGRHRHCDGTKAEIDTLVLCTGFDIWEANIPAIEIIGRDAPQSRKVVARQRLPGLPGSDGARSSRTS